MKTVGYVCSIFPEFYGTFTGTEIRAMEAIGHTIVPIAFSKSTGVIQNKDKRFINNTYYIDSMNTQGALLVLVNSAIRLTRKLSIFSCLNETLKWRSAILYALKQKEMDPTKLLWQAAKVAYVAQKQGCQHLHASFAGNTISISIMVGKLLGIPVSFSCKGLDFRRPLNDISLQINNASFVVVDSSQMQRNVLSLSPRKTIVLMPNGIDIDAFPLSVDVTFKRRFLIVSRLVERKGLEDVLDALDLLPKTNVPNVDIVGDGPLQPVLISKISEYSLSDKISFLGTKDAQWFAENTHRYGGLIYPGSDFCSDNLDAGPLVIKEAMALGLPLVCLPSKVDAEFLGGRYNLQVISGNAANLAQEMMKLLKMNEKERICNILDGRGRVARYYSARETTKILSEAINSTYEQ